MTYLLLQYKLFESAEFAGDVAYVEYAEERCAENENARKAEGLTSDGRKKRDDDGRSMTTDQPYGVPPTTERQWKPRRKP